MTTAFLAGATPKTATSLDNLAFLELDLGKTSEARQRSQTEGQARQRDRSDKEEGERRRDWNQDHGCRKFEFEGRRGRGGSKQIGRSLSHAPFRRNKARDAWQKTTRQALSTEQVDRVTNRAGKDLNRSVGLADRGSPRESQYSPGLLSAWQGTDVGNPACA